MFQVNIPGGPSLQLQHLVLDYNGTLAQDGKLLPGVAERLAALADRLTLHVLTADTFGTSAAEVAQLPVQLTIVPAGNQAAAKLAYIRHLGPEVCVCIGNGRNDHLMLAEAALGIAVVGPEGAARETLQAAKVVAPNILAALDLLLRPSRLQATLRD